MRHAGIDIGTEWGSCDFRLLAK